MKSSTKIILFISISSLLILIFQKQIKSILKEKLGGYKWFEESLKWYRDEKTKTIIYNLHPSIIYDFKEFLSRVEKEIGLQIIATSGYRTWAEQANLHKQNKQNASAGNSDHNYGFALDINALDKSGKNILMKATSKQKWQESGLVDIAKNMGFKWGGDFQSYHDPVHFYKQPLSTSEMKAKYLAGNKNINGYINLT